MALLTNIHDALSKARTNAHDAKDKTRAALNPDHLSTFETQYVDLTIKFIGARDLPKMDMVGSADPYFVARLDDKIQFVSTVQGNTREPVWNELWHVKNVPTTANLSVEVLDKDSGPTDDHIGRFHTTVSPGAKEVEIEGSILKRTKGTFWLTIDSRKPAHEVERCPPYTFDGPIRFSRHFSPTVGRLTNINDERLYSTWKVYLKAVPMFFGETTQGWNKEYRAAQTIFGTGTSAFAVRSSIQAGHRLLYARSTRNGFGTLESAADVMGLLQGTLSAGARALAPHRVKPAVYTYVVAVDDGSFRFSETGAAFFVDFASKHALHANCAEAVRYSGEFHPRPEGGWAAYSEERSDEETKWELVIDNNSGTYSPNKEDLPRLRELLEYNFPGFRIVALDHEDAELKESREACREYALKYRGVRREELQPHAEEGEQTLLNRVSAGMAGPTDDTMMGEGMEMGRV